jgi:hypothetical protein
MPLAKPKTRSVNTTLTNNYGFILVPEHKKLYIAGSNPKNKFYPNVLASNFFTG